MALSVVISVKLEKAADPVKMIPIERATITAGFRFSVDKCG